MSANFSPNVASGALSVARKWRDCGLMRIVLGADKVTLLEFTRANLRLLFVIPGFYPIRDIWKFIARTLNDHVSPQ